MQKLTISLLMLTVSLLSSASSFSTTGFTEPVIIVYGKVFNDAISPPAQTYSGEMVWTLTPQSGPPVEVVGKLSNQADGTFSYRLEIPVEKAPSGFSQSQGTVSASATPAAYELTVSIDGSPASVTDETGQPRTEPLSYAELLRGRRERVDLTFTGVIQDSDNDLMPDSYEQQYASVLNPHDPNDAALDSDGDGLANVVEYLEGTDPACFEWVKWLARHQLLTAAPEMRAIWADPDQDGLSNSLEYATGCDPRTPDAELLQDALSIAIEQDPTDGRQYLTLTLDYPPHRTCHAEVFAAVSADLSQWKREDGVDVKSLLNSPGALKTRDMLAVDESDDARYMRLEVVITP